MNFRAFNNYMNAVMNAIDAQHNHLDEQAEITFTNNGKWALRKLEKIFKDKDQNIRRWLNGKPCVYTSEKAGNKIEVCIGDDREAIFYFLVFCYRINTNQQICEEFRDYLLYLVLRSRATYWAESNVK